MATPAAIVIRRAKKALKLRQTTPLVARPSKRKVG